MKVMIADLVFLEHTKYVISDCRRGPMTSVIYLELFVLGLLLKVSLSSVLIKLSLSQASHLNILLMNECFK